MTRQTQIWTLVSALVALAAGVGALAFRAREELPRWQEPIALIGIGSALAFAVVIVLVVFGAVY